MRYFECKATMKKELKTRSDAWSDVCNEVGNICQEYCDRNEDRFSMFVTSLRCKNCTFIIGGNGSDKAFTSECEVIWKSFGINGNIESITEISAEKVLRDIRNCRDVDKPDDIDDLINTSVTAATVAML